MNDYSELVEALRTNDLWPEVEMGGKKIDAQREAADALEALIAELAPFQAAAAEYGIDAQTMLTLARSQIETAKENVRLRELIEKLNLRAEYNGSMAGQGFNW